MTQNKVDLINKCLISIGEAPIPEDTLLDTIQLGTDIDIARRMVESTLKEVLAKGWYFNMDYDYELIPDVNDFITLPANVYRADINEGQQYVVRNQRVYDVYNHTYKIYEKLTADLIYSLEPDELPIQAYEYIGARASRKFQEKVIGDLNMVQITMGEEVDTYNELMRLQLQTQDYSLVRGSRITNAPLTANLYKNKGRR